MNIIDFLKQYGHNKYHNFVLCKTERYELILLPYIYGNPDGIIIDKTYKDNWNVLNCNGSHLYGKRIKHNFKTVAKFKDGELYLKTGTVYTDNEKCLLDVSINHEFGDALHLTYDEILNKVDKSDNVELFPEHRYLISLHSFTIDGYVYYFAISRDQFDIDYVKVHYFSFVQEFKIELLDKDCTTFTTYRDGGTMLIDFNDIEVYIPSSLKKENKAEITILNKKYKMVNVIDEKIIQLCNDYLKLKQKIK